MTISASRYAPEMVQIGSTVVINNVEWKIASILGDFAILSLETMMGRKETTVPLKSLVELQRFRGSISGFDSSKVN